MFIGKDRATLGAWKVTVAIGFMMATVLAGALDLQAQGVSSTELGWPFRGLWDVAPDGRDFSQATSCGPEHGGAGRCSIPLDRLKPYLHPRAIAWMEFAGITDERLSGKWDCLATPLPSALEDPFEIRLPSETTIHIQRHWDNDYVRVVHMDGRQHSSGYTRVSYMGESIGRYEGDELVIVTTNFTFDPDGLDDHLHLPSSVRKKITERYKSTGADTMTLTVTHEDPLFLREPFTWTLQLEKIDQSDIGVFGLPYEPNPCNVDAAHAELELIVDKYEGQ